MPESKIVTTDWPRVVLFILCGIFAAFQVGKVPASLLAIRADLGLGLVTSGWVISMYSVTGAIAGLAAGIVTDRLGHRRTLLGGLLCTAIASVGGALVQDGASLLVSRFFEGLGFILTVVSVPTLMLRLVAADQRTTVMGLWGAYMPTGTAAMIMLSPVLLASIGWRGLWLTIAVLLLGLTATMAVIARPGAAAPGRKPDVKPGGCVASGVSQTLKRPGPWLLALCFGVYAGQFMTVMGFLPTLLVDLGLSGTLAASLTALAVAVNIAGNIATGWLLGRRCRRWALIVVTGVVMIVADMVIFDAGWPLAWRFIAVLLLSGVGGMIPGSLMVGAVFHAPAPGLLGTTTGLMMQGSNIGQVLTPPAVAALVTASGQWDTAPAILAPLAAISVLCGAMLRRVEKKMTNV